MLESSEELRAKGKQVDDEDREQGSVSWSVVKAYLGTLGDCKLWVLLVAATVLLHVFGPITDLWMAGWTTSANADPSGVSPDNTFFMAGYIVVTIICA